MKILNGLTVNLNSSLSGVLNVVGAINTSAKYQINGVDGYTGTFNDGTVVAGGIITSPNTSGITASGKNTYLPASYTFSVGGTGDGSAGYFAPSGISQAGVTIRTPAGYTGNDFQAFDAAGTLRTSLNSAGIQNWYLLSGNSVSGQIAYGMPNDNPGILFFTGTNGSNRFNIANYGTSFRLYYQSDSSSGATGLTIASGGKVGVNNTSPSVALDINGTTRSAIVNATTKYQANGTDGYTGNIPMTALNTHVKGGIIVGYTAADGTTVGQ